MTTKVDHIANQLEAATAEYEKGLAALKRPDGRPLYSTEEEQQRRRALEATYQAKQQQARDRLAEVTAQAEQQLAEASVADPLSRLSDTELDRASKLRGFIAGDYATLPIEALVSRAREALRAGDKALCATHLRYGRSVTTDRPSEAYELRQVLTELESTMIDVQARDSAQATIEAAQRLQVQLASSGYLQRVYGGGAVPQRSIA